MNLTHDNPFRILGLPLTAGAKDIAKQVNTLATYAEMGKSKAFDRDFSFLRPVNRTTEAITEANKRIEQSENKLLYSLFWFWNNNSVDELAIDVLQEGRVERAIEIWEKATFANTEKTYKPVALYDNLIRQSSDWIEEDIDNHSLIKNGEGYVIERKAATSYSIPTVPAELGVDEEDWSIECDTEWIEGVDSWGYGIVFGRDKGSYFSFEIAANGNHCFDKYVDWNFTSLIPWKSSDVVDTWGSNHLRITCTSNQLRFHINGQFVDCFEREPFFGDHLGFILMRAQTIAFSNFKICRLVEDDAYGAGIRVSSKNFSNIKNLSVLFLSLSAVNGEPLREDYLRKGIALASKCFSDEQIEDYAKKVAGDRYVYDPGKALEFYIGNIVDSLKQYLGKPAGISTGQLIQTFSDYPIEAKQYINTRFLAKPIHHIEREIESAQAAKRSSPSSAVDIGKSLVESTKSDLELLKAALGKSDYQYRSIADKLANQVIQCGIDYFNATRNDSPSLPLYEYGYLVAVSPATQERAKENLDSCKEWIIIAKPIQNIDKEIESAHAARSASPSCAVDIGKSLVEATKSDIEVLKTALGNSDYRYQNMADRLANQVIQCGIDSFNATHNDEPGLPLYEYGSLVAVSLETQERAKENLNSCKEWIKNKIYYFCWFCGENQPDSNAAFSKTIYKETSRSSFPSSVRFSYVSIPIPRCSECRELQGRSLGKYWMGLIGWLSGCAAIGTIIGAVVDSIPDLSAVEGSRAQAGALLGALAGAFIGWMVSERRRSSQLSEAGVKDTSKSTISQYPIIRQRLKQGWQFSQPSA